MSYEVTQGMSYNEPHVLSDLLNLKSKVDSEKCKIGKANFQHLYFQLAQSFADSTMLAHRSPAMVRTLEIFSSC
jgi:hypothetical protein